jgi:hypothetical protein
MKQLLSFLVLTVTFAAFANTSEPTVEAGHGTEKAAAHASKKGGADLNLFPPPQADHSKVARPAKPELVEPAFHSKTTAEAITLKWNAVATADAYHLQVATDPNFKWLVNEEMMTKNTSFEVKGLKPATHYFWRVAALKTDNTQTYMKGWFASSEFEKP